MIKLRWLLAVSVMLAAAVVAAPATAAAATIRDRGEMFSKDAVKKADALLEKVQSASGVPIVIETIDAIPDLDHNATHQQRRRAIDALALRRDKEIRDEGIYLLISKRDRVISHVLVRERLGDVLPIGKRDAIQEAFVQEFKKEGGFDAGLLSGARAIEKALEGVSVRGAGLAAHGGGVARVPRRADGGRVPAGRSTMGTFLMIILGIFGVLLVLRLIGGLFNRSAGQGYPGQAGMGMRGAGMGGGPGYGGGGPGYGGRGGGFMSGMLGGLGGALAGNWLYDQFSGGRHGQYGSADAGAVPDSTGAPDQGGDAIIGGADDPGGGASWDDGGGGGDVGGGDWGGGGGDWGGGGGDWGGGGGDW
jgi:TPM domain